MIGLDTNVLLRLLIRDDEAQYQRVLAHWRSGAWNDGAIIDPIVLAEATWTLTMQWKRPRSEVADFVESILTTEGIVVTRERAVARALDRYRVGKADFADCLIAELNIEAGAATTITFDVTAQDQPGFSPVP